MAKDRRDFLKTTLGAGFGLALSGPAFAGIRPAFSKSEAGGPAGPGKKILILGGTRFLGPAIVEAAQRRGHTLTLFNRGKTNPDLFPDLETLIGDRDGKLDALKGRTWDAVVDTSGFVPRIVRMSAGLLAPSVKQYVFISSISVYADPLKPGADESAPLQTLEDPTTEEVMKHYGALKAACEAEAAKAFPKTAMNIRPGLIVGPEDGSDRFTYWPVRIAKGGEVLAPGDGKDPVQVIDVRDLGTWIVRAVEKGLAGPYNAVGPEKPMTMKEMLEACRKAAKSDAKLTWVPAEFLEEHKVAPWGDMPAWVPRTSDSAGYGAVDGGKAIAAGLTFRPIERTAADTLAWWNAEPAERREKLKAGLAPEREAEVLAAWKAKRAKPSK